MKGTKIIATISSLRCGEPFLRRLHKAGMDAVRINTAHLSVQEARGIIKNTRRVSNKLAVIIDTKGPEIRTSPTEQPIEFKRGYAVQFRDDNPKAASTKECIYVNYNKFVKTVPKGAHIYVDDGLLCFYVTKKTKNTLHCVARNSGTLRSNKSINVPEVPIDLPSISKRDKEFIQLAIREDVEYIAHSFVRYKQDVQALQRILDKKKSKVKIIAKIEDSQGLKNLDEILDHAAAIMVARGDLATEIPPEEVPIAQKTIIQKCLDRAKPVITATQMLHSMIDHPRPTRAEVSDVANAIYDGTDAVMLSGETAQGDYPVEAVQMMARIAKATEIHRPVHLIATHLERASAGTSNYIARGAARAARELPTKAIVVGTTSGMTALNVARFRGTDPIYAQCFNDRVMRELAIAFGVHPDRMALPKSTNSLVTGALRPLVKQKKLWMGDLIVFVCGIPGKKKLSTVLEIITVKEALEKYKGR